MTTTALAPTERQQAFAATLAAERGIACPTFSTRREASAVIDALLATPRPRRAATGTSATTRTTTRSPRLATEVPAGRFAVASRTGQNDLDFFQIDRPTEGRWAGFVFVRRIIGGHEPITVRGAEAASAVAAIEAAGWQAAAARFGQEIGSCSRCGRSLTDEASRAFGIGPDCRGFWGL
jgi:hypothetical protein